MGIVNIAKTIGKKTSLNEELWARQESVKATSKIQDDIRKKAEAAAKLPPKWEVPITNNSASTKVSENKYERKKMPETPPITNNSASTETSNYNKQLENKLEQINNQEAQTVNNASETPNNNESIIKNAEKAQTQEQEKYAKAGEAQKTAETQDAAKAKEQSDGPSLSPEVLKYSLGGVMLGGLVLNMSNSRGQQTNAQLYGQVPVGY